MLGSTGSSRLRISLRIRGGSGRLVGLVGDVRKRSGLGSTGRATLTATGAASTTAAAATATTTRTTLLVASLGRLLLIVLGLAGKLDTNLALEDILARQILDSLGGLIGGLQIDKGIANGSVGARVDGDGGAFAMRCQANGHDHK